MEWVGNAARRLEHGSFDGRLGRGAERIWQAFSATRVARPLVLPSGVRTIAIGGATLGGSGKTPLSLVCAEFAKNHGAKVALIGHAFRASPGHARIVRPDDDVASVGDEALVCARRVSPGVSVVVGPTRQAAIDHAALCGAEVIVLDGVAQASPRPALLALLALHGSKPWGAGACPPRGDLRAPKSALLGACDKAVMLSDELDDDCGEALPGDDRDRVLEVLMKSHGAWTGTRYVDYPELSGLRLGLVTSLARPHRLVAWLARRHVVPQIVLSAGDHRPVSPRAMRDVGNGLDAWLATEKCATHLHGPFGPPVLTLDYRAFPAAALTRTLGAALTAQTSGHRLENSEFSPCALGIEPRKNWGP